MQVFENRCTIVCEDERRWEGARDLLVSLFELLAETPLVQLGINMEAILAAESEDQWDKLGWTLVPKSFWQDKLNNPGMARLQVREKKRDDKFHGYFDIQVMPHNYIPEAKQFGVHLLVNDHYQIEDARTVIRADDIINILKAQWETSTKRSLEMIKSISEIV